MSYVLRYWRCLNRRCGRQFETGEPNPECPHCHGVRVDWVPGGGHIAGTAKGADNELRKLADVFRMNDIASSRRGEASKRVTAQPAAFGPVHTFAPGFSAAVNPQAATCTPSTSGVDFKVKAGIGRQLPANASYPSMRSNTAIEASHKQ
jgi:hypothetical protein